MLRFTCGRQHGHPALSTRACRLGAHPTWGARKTRTGLAIVPIGVGGRCAGDRESPAHGPLRGLSARQLRGGRGAARVLSAGQLDLRIAERALAQVHERGSLPSCSTDTPKPHDVWGRDLQAVMERAIEVLVGQSGGDASPDGQAVYLQHLYRLSPAAVRAEMRRLVAADSAPGPSGFDSQSRATRAALSVRRVDTVATRLLRRRLHHFRYVDVACKRSLRCAAAWASTRMPLVQDVCSRTSTTASARPSRNPTVARRGGRLGWQLTPGHCAGARSRKSRQHRLSAPGKRGSLQVCHQTQARSACALRDPPR
jgi:hypothetical protein